MKLSPALKQYTEETRSAKEAQRLAEFIAWGTDRVPSVALNGEVWHLKSAS